MPLSVASLGRIKARDKTSCLIHDFVAFIGCDLMGLISSC
jgi:hypothetical protein